MTYSLRPLKLSLGAQAWTDCKWPSHTQKQLQKRQATIITTTNNSTRNIFVDKQHVNLFGKWQRILFFLFFGVHLWPTGRIRNQSKVAISRRVVYTENDYGIVTMLLWTVVIVMVDIVVVAVVTVLLAIASSATVAMKCSGKESYLSARRKGNKYNNEEYKKNQW